MELEELQSAVAKLLITEHDFSSDEADEVIAESTSDHPEMWSENAEPKDLANFLASDDDDD